MASPREFCLALTLTVVGFSVAVVSLLSYRLRLWPWEIRAWSDEQMDPLLVAIAQESQIEIAVFATVAAVSFAAWCWNRRAWARRLDALLVPDPALDADAEPGADLDAEADAATGQRAEPATAATDARRSIEEAELHRLRRELSDTRQRLDHALHAKGHFLANMSHELRTPMNGIMGMTELLLSSPLPDREKRFVSSIGTSAESLLGIINDLLDFSKIETGSLQLDRSRFRIRDCVEDICSALAQPAHVKGVELVCYVDDAVPEYLEGDAGRVRQILKNLIGNAVAYTHEGEVVVRVVCDDESGRERRLTFDVQDSGIGMAPELQARLFSAFSHSDAGDVRREGVGMGLAISQQLIRLMGGEISFRSRLGEGTRFTFTMRLAVASDRETSTEEKRTLRGARVLVVDDNETNRTILYHQLDHWGVQVDTVDGGSSALTYLGRAAADGYPYDAMVLDLHMPEMDGIELARAVAADPDIRDIRSLMLTSTVLDLDSTALSEIGIDKYVSKPARQTLLHDSLVSILPHIARDQSATADADEPVTPVKVAARVLLVEDNVVNQDVAAGMLDKLGCTVEIASDGRAAVELAASRSFDLILMDCQMPHMDGFDATRRIRAGGGAKSSIPIIALTAHALDGDRDRCIEAGMDDYLSKPVRLEQIGDLLVKWAGQRVGAPDARSPATATVAATPVANLGAVTAGADAQDIDAMTPAEPDVDAAPSSETVRVLDPAAIDQIRGMQTDDTNDLVGRVVRMYLDQSPALIDALQQAINDGDIEAMTRSARSLKSSSAYLGAEALAARLEDLEHALESDRSDTLPERVGDIRNDYDAVILELAGYLDAA